MSPSFQRQHFGLHKLGRLEKARSCGKNMVLNIDKETYHSTHPEQPPLQN